MTEAMIDLPEVITKSEGEMRPWLPTGCVSASTHFLRELIQGAAQRLMELDRQAIAPVDRWQGE